MAQNGVPPSNTDHSQFPVYVGWHNDTTRRTTLRTGSPELVWVPTASLAATQDLKALHNLPPLATEFRPIEAGVTPSVLGQTHDVYTCTTAVTRTIDRIRRQVLTADVRPQNDLTWRDRINATLHAVRDLLSPSSVNMTPLLGLARAVATWLKCADIIKNMPDATKANLTDQPLATSADVVDFCDALTTRWDTKNANTDCLWFEAIYNKLAQDRTGVHGRANMPKAFKTSACLFHNWGSAAHLLQHAGLGGERQVFSYIVQLRAGKTIPTNIYSGQYDPRTSTESGEELEAIVSGHFNLKTREEQLNTLTHGGTTVTNADEHRFYAAMMAAMQRALESSFTATVLEPDNIFTGSEFDANFIYTARENQHAHTVSHNSDVLDTCRAFYAYQLGNSCGNSWHDHAFIDKENTKPWFRAADTDMRGGQRQCRLFGRGPVNNNGHA